MEEAINTGEVPGSPPPVYTTESDEASDGEVLPPYPVQTPASVEGPIRPPLTRTPATVNHNEAVDGRIRPRPMGIPASMRPIESVDGHIWPRPMRTPQTMSPIEAIEGHVLPRRMRSPASMPSAGRHDGLPEVHRFPESGNRRLPELAIDEQEYWRRQHGGGEALAAPAMDGTFPVYRRNTISLSRACLTFVVLVVVVMTCYIIGTRLVFLAKWSPASLINSFYGPSRNTATRGTPQPPVWR